MTPLTGLGLLAACLAVEAFFSGSEMALVSADRHALQLKASEGDAGAERALALLDDEASLLGTCLIGTNLSVVSGSALFMNLLLAQGFAEAWALAYVPFALILGEALPKTVMQHHADRVSTAISLPLDLARKLFTPFLIVVRWWNRALSWATGAGPTGYLTRQELLDLLEDHEPGPIAPEDRRLIRGVLELRTTTVYDAMTPLVQVVAVHEDATVGFAVDIATRTQHSRVPVYRQRIDNIIGMVHQSDLLFLTDDREPLAPHVNRVRFVPDQKSAKALFEEMRKEGDHFAVIVDEYGGCVGIVTLEDLLEQFVGDIEDERDVPEKALERHADGSITLAAQLDLEGARSALGVDFPEGPYETLAGLMLHRLGRIPERGAEIEVEGMRLRVEEASDRALLRLRATPVTPPAAAP